VRYGESLLPSPFSLLTSPFSLLIPSPQIRQEAPGELLDDRLVSQGAEARLRPADEDDGAQGTHELQVAELDRQRRIGVAEVPDAQLRQLRDASDDEAVELAGALEQTALRTGKAVLDERTDGRVVPPVGAYLDGERILFINGVRTTFYPQSPS